MKSSVTKANLTAEFIGSMLLIIAAVSPIILFIHVFESHTGVALIANAIAVAWVLFALIEMFMHISGAHFNPVVTMAFVLDKKISCAKAMLYVIAQIAGGICGIIISHVMFYNEIGELLSVSNVTRGGFAYFSEIICTFVLVLAILLLVKVESTKISIIVSLLVGGMILSTSSTMFANPQVTIARMFTNSAAGVRPADGFVFILMQLTGALLAYGIYKLIFSKTESEGIKNE